jgi:DNA-binding MarR family transcriptional regulator
MRRQTGSPAGPERLGRALLLLNTLSVDMTHVAATALGRDELAANRDVQILLLVRRAGGLTPTDIAGTAGMSRSAVSRVLTRLESAKLVRRQQGAADHRTVQVTLSRTGHQRVLALQRQLVQYVRSNEPRIREFVELLHVPPAGIGPEPSDFLMAVEHMGHIGELLRRDGLSAVAPYGVQGTTERFALSLIHDHVRVRPSQLAAELHLTSSGISALLDRLDAAGLVLRRHDVTPEDRRAVVVQLTERGTDVARALLEVLQRHSHEVGLSFARALDAASVAGSASA